MQIALLGVQGCCCLILFWSVSNSSLIDGCWKGFIEWQMNTVSVFSAAWSLNISKLSRIALVVDLWCISFFALGFFITLHLERFRDWGLRETTQLHCCACDYIAIRCWHVGPYGLESGSGSRRLCGRLCVAAYPPVVDTTPLYGSMTGVLRVHLDPLSLACASWTSWKTTTKFPPLNFSLFMTGSQEVWVRERKGERNICDCSKCTFVDRVSSVSMEN